MEPKQLNNISVQLSVGSIGTNGGVYIGTKNVQVGISHSSKANTGFGSIDGQGNYVYQNLAYVYDPDIIDTAIDDRDVKILNTSPDESFTNIMFQTMAVTTMSQNAGVFIGDTAIAGLDSHEKDNIGFGKVFGHQNVHQSNVGINYDPDIIDTPINDQDMKVSHGINV